jgi:hypothetical protein
MRANDHPTAAVGMSVNDYLHEAVLAAIALRRDRDLHARVREAVRTAHGTRAEDRAVRSRAGRRSRVARRRRRAP